MCCLFFGTIQRANASLLSPLRGFVVFAIILYPPLKVVGYFRLSLRDIKCGGRFRIAVHFFGTIERVNANLLSPLRGLGLIPAPFPTTKSGGLFSVVPTGHKMRRAGFTNRMPTTKSA
jgi:hypothetical protein